MNEILTPPYDVVPLPSKGLFYKHKKESLKVSYLNATDENILNSPNLIANGKIFDVLLKNKILDRDVAPESLLAGDKIAILFFLRSTSFGSEYKISAIDPITQKQFETVVDVSNLKYKDILVEPDENGECEFILPTSKHLIKFRYLTESEEEKIRIESDKIQKQKGSNAPSTFYTDLLKEQVTEFNGSRNKLEIGQSLSLIPITDSRAFKKFIDDNEPGIDTKIEVQAPSGEFFFHGLTITSELFWPE